MLSPQRMLHVSASYIEWVLVLRVQNSCEAQPGFCPRGTLGSCVKRFSKRNTTVTTHITHSHKTFHTDANLTPTHPSSHTHSSSV